jgi:hypothetical protein
VTGNPKDKSDREVQDDAGARAWARAARKRAEAGLVRDDLDFLERKLAEERRRLADRDLGGSARRR